MIEFTRIDLSPERLVACDHNSRSSKFTTEDIENSVATYGIINPIIVREHPKGDFQVVSGQRRVTAAINKGLKTVPCLMPKVGMKDHEARMLSLVENMCRKNLSPMDEAAAFDAIVKKTDLTPLFIADKIGKVRNYVYNRMKLLDLPLRVQHLLSLNKITVGCADKLARVRDKNTVERWATQMSRGGKDGGPMSDREARSFLMSVRIGKRFDTMQDPNSLMTKQQLLVKLRNAQSFIQNLKHALTGTWAYKGSDADLIKLAFKCRAAYQGV